MKARLSRRATPVELAGEFAGFMRELAEAGVDEIHNASFYFLPLNDGEPIHFEDAHGRRCVSVDVNQGPTPGPQQWR